MPQPRGEGGRISPTKSPTFVNKPFCGQKLDGYIVFARQSTLGARPPPPGGLNPGGPSPPPSTLSLEGRLRLGDALVPVSALVFRIKIENS